MERPEKKQRLQGPDGFQKSKPTSRYKPPESITKFVSAFDNVPPSAVKPAAQPKDPSKKKPVFLPSYEPFQNPFLDTHIPRERDAGPSGPSVPKRPLTTSSFAHPPHAAAKADKPLPLLRVQKPPVPLAAAAPPQTTKGLSNKTTTPSSLQPVLKLPVVPPKEKHRSILNPPPLLIPAETKLSVPLKPLAPPPVLPLHRPASPNKPMKTILTTNVALATDPTKEGTGVELLSLFLQQHGHNFISPMDRELQRGVMVSPDKRSHGKDPKFLRGGLAEHFHHRISCTKTDFTLWKRQLELKIESGTRFRSDMQLRILRVLDSVKASERVRFTGPWSGLALCRLTQRHQLASGDLTLGTYVVVFHFAPTNGGRSPVSSIDRFEEGNDVMVWLPWHKIELAGVEESAGLLEMFRTLDALTPPRSLLVMSRFYMVVPRLVDAT